MTDDNEDSVESRRNAQRLVAAAVSAIEAAILAAVAVFYLAELRQGEADSVAQASTSLALIIVFAMALVVGARAWVRRQWWVRTPTIVWNALLLPVSWSLVTGGQPLAGTVLAVLALAGVASSVAAPSTRPGEDGSDDSTGVF